MKKIIFSLATAVALLTGLSANAQTTNCNNACPVQKENCNKVCDTNKACSTKQVCDADKPCGTPCAASKPGQCTSRFANLNLTQEQKTALEKLRKETGERCKAESKKAKADSKEAKAARKAQRESNRRQYLAEVQKILTPEQYVQFLENSFTNPKSKDKKVKSHKGDRKAKIDRHHARHRGDSCCNAQSKR